MSNCGYIPAVLPQAQKQSDAAHALCGPQQMLPCLTCLCLDSKVPGLPGEAEATACLESAGASALSFLDSLLEYKEKTPTRGRLIQRNK